MLAGGTGTVGTSVSVSDPSFPLTYTFSFPGAVGASILERDSGRDGKRAADVRDVEPLDARRGRRQVQHLAEFQIIALGHDRNRQVPWRPFEARGLLRRATHRGERVAQLGRL